MDMDASAISHLGMGDDDDRDDAYLEGEHDSGDNEGKLTPRGAVD